jgi:hypothetical protein
MRAVCAVTVSLAMLRRRLADRRPSSSASRSRDQPRHASASRRRRVPKAGTWLRGARVAGPVCSARMRAAVSRRTLTVVGPPSGHVLARTRTWLSDSPVSWAMRSTPIPAARSAVRCSRTGPASVNGCQWPMACCRYLLRLAAVLAAVQSGHLQESFTYATRVPWRCGLPSWVQFRRGRVPSAAPLRVRAPALTGRGLGGTAASAPDDIAGEGADARL